VIHPTIEGVKNRRDKLLEKAIKVILEEYNAALKWIILRFRKCIKSSFEFDTLF